MTKRQTTNPSSCSSEAVFSLSSSISSNCHPGSSNKPRHSINNRSKLRQKNPAILPKAIMTTPYRPDNHQTQTNNHPPPPKKRRHPASQPSSTRPGTLPLSGREGMPHGPVCTRSLTCLDIGNPRSAYTRPARPMPRSRTGQARPSGCARYRTRHSVAGR